MTGGDVAGAVAGLREQSSGDILVAGSAQLVSALLEHDLVDELRLMVIPVVPGADKRPFPDGAGTAAFRVVETKRGWPNGKSDREFPLSHLVVGVRAWRYLSRGIIAAHSEPITNAEAKRQTRREAGTQSQRSP